MLATKVVTFVHPLSRLIRGNTNSGEGDLICEIKDPQTLEAVVTLDEEQAAEIEPGQLVRLKARALPFQVFEARVERIALRAVAGDLQSTVTVYYRLQESHEELRSSMQGTPAFSAVVVTSAWFLPNAACG